MRFALLVLALPALLAAAPAQAVEPFKIYDRFTDKPISPLRWQEGERIRTIKNGSLQLMQRTWSLPFSDVGLFATNWQLDFQNQPAITAIKARVTVDALETAPCPTNGSIGDARARIIGGFFNVGVPTPGSQVGDAIAQVRLFRASNSADPAGLLRLQGLLSICSNADCSGATTVGNIVDLGTVALGTPTTIGLQWDKAGKTFYFSREGATTGTVAYAQSDSSLPSLMFRQLSTRVNVPNCFSAPAVSAVVDARFDNVSVNASAAP